MTPIPPWHEVAIEKKHNRKGFDCGQDDLNAFLTLYARKAHENGASKTYVAIDAADGVTIFGFYTLSPAQVDFHRVPNIALPIGGGRHAVGGFRLGRLAVRKTFQGQGLGGQLLAAATMRCMRASAEMGGTALMIDAKDERVAAWYKSYGAVSLHDNPLSLLLSYSLFVAAVAAAGTDTYSSGAYPFSAGI
jgi:GNAT superfamily N-acetyltransferase